MLPSKINQILMDHVYFNYDYEENSVLTDISIKVHKQDCVVFLGISGSGKTTFLKLCSGLYQPVKGNVSLFGQDLSTMTVSERSIFYMEHIGYMFQDGGLIQNLTIYDNLALQLRYNATLKEADVKEMIFEGLNHFEIAELANKVPANLSLGQRKIVGFLRAVLHMPPLVLLDDPTSNVDLQTSEKMLDLIRRLNILGITVVAISNDMFFANAIANYFGIFFDGNLVTMDSPSIVKKSSDSRISKVIKNASQDADLADELLKLMA